MAFDFSCPVCKHTMQMDNSAAGEMGDCPKCEAEVLIQRSPVGTETDELQMDNEEQPQSSFASDESEVELDVGTSVATRIVVYAFLLCVIGFPVFFMFNGKS